MSITVTLQGVDYTIPSPGEANWGNTLNAYLEAVATALSSASQSTETIIWGANVVAAAGVPGDPQGMFLGSSDATPTVGVWKWQPAYAGQIRGLYANVCDGSFTGGVDTVTLSVTNASTAHVESVTIESPLTTGALEGVMMIVSPGDLIYAQVTMNAPAVTFPGRMAFSVQVVKDAF